MTNKEFHQIMTALSLMGHVNQHEQRFVPVSSVMQLLATFVDEEESGENDGN